MKVLFVTLYSFFANNSGMMRNRAIVKGLIENGNTVDILTIKPKKFQETISNIDFKLNDCFYAGNNNLYDNITNQSEKKRSKIKHLLEKVLRSIYHKFYPFDYTMRIAKKITINVLNNNEYDLIISSSNPFSSHKAVEKLIKQGLVYKKWIQYWGDPLSYNISDNTFLPNFFLRMLEKKLFSVANKIVFVSPLTLEYEKKYHNFHSKKMFWLPIPSENNRMYNGTKFISYFGDYISKTRNIYPFYEAVSDLNIPTIIAGTSDIKLASTNNVFIYERCDVSKYMEETKLLVVILNRYGTQIPGKIFHCAGTNIKILVICDGDYSKNIQSYFNQYKKRFVFCDNSKDSIKLAIQNIMLDNNQVMPITDFSSKIVAEQLLSLVQI